MSFKAIETQEELDRIIQDRLAREKEKYSDYDELKKSKVDLEAQVGTLQTANEKSLQQLKEHDATVSDLNAKIAGYETANLRTRIAIKNGLPIDLADRLVGEDEESIMADAERLAGFVKPKATTPPLKNVEPDLGDGKDGAYKNLIENLNLEGE